MCAIGIGRYRGLAGDAPLCGGESVASGDAQYTIGHLDRLSELEAALSRFGGLGLTGAGYRGVGIPDCIRDGTEMAAQTLRYLKTMKT